MGQLTALARAKELIRDRERTRRESRTRKLELDAEYEELFKKLADTSRSEVGLGYCLLKNEKILLAEYIVSALQKSITDSIGRLSRILLEEPCSEAHSLLYFGVLGNYESEAAQVVAKLLAADRQFLRTISTEVLKNLSIDTNTVAEIMNAVVSSNVQMTICDVASRKLGTLPYPDILTGLGLGADSKLYRECMELYIVVCDGDEYRRTGEDKLFEIALGFDDELKGRLLRNMLITLDKFQLRSFTKLLDIFVPLVGEKGTGNYANALLGLEASALARFNAWTNQYKIRGILGTGEIADFWMGFCDKATILVLKSQQALIIDFDTFKVIESAVVDAAYFYDKEYYDKVVCDLVNVAQNSEELENKLYNKTEWASQGENLLHWRRAHIRNWQLDMKGYISKNMRHET